MTETTTDTGETPKKRTIGTHLFLLSCMLMVVGFFVWATKGTLDVVSSTTGEVVPSSQIKTVQHLEGGIISAINIKEGDRVRRGQALIELQPTATDTQIAEVKIRLTSLEANIARLEAEISGAKIPKFSPTLIAEDPTSVARAISLFKTRKRRVEAQLAEQRALIVQRQLDIEEVKARIKNNSESFKLVDDQVKISKKLLKMSLTNRMRHLDLQKEATTLNGQIAADKTVLPRAVAAQQQARARLSAITSGFREESSLALDESLRSFAELTQRMIKFQDSSKRTVLRAPVDGIVKTVYVATQGGVIQAGQTVVDIVPAGDRLIIEARLPTGDIGYVRSGQKVLVRLATADGARFGVLESEVMQVSPDTIVSEQGVPFYKVKINTSKNYFEQGDLRHDLFPGMQVQTDIQTGTRTVLEYLVDPYIQSFGRALRER